MNRKVTVIGGAGNVGATVARAIAVKELADVVVIDIADQKAAGLALDLFEANPIEGSDARLIGGGDYADAAGSDVVVITSGVPRKPGMSRDDLLQVNYKIMQQVTEQVVKHCPHAIIVPVANPLDAMCQAVYRLSGFPRERVIGMAGVLDSARMRAFIALELNVSVENIHAFVLGGHGDTMVPLPRYSTVAGIPITDLLPKDRIDAICKRTADGGAEITKLVGTSAWYAPGSAAAEMVEIILKDKKKIVPCSVFLQGEYGIRDLFVGVPVKLGAQGVEEIVQIKLTAEEQAALNKSAAAVKELTDIIKGGRLPRPPRQPSLLLHGERNRQLGCFPRNLQRRGVAGAGLDGNRQLIDGRRQRLLREIDTCQILLLVVLGAPLAGLLVQNQLPLIFAGQGVQRDLPGRNRRAADDQRLVRRQRRRGIRAGAPDAPVRNQAPHNLSSANVGAAVLDRNFSTANGCLDGLVRAARRLSERRDRHRRGRRDNGGGGDEY
jgi:malate dehydrogenase